MCLDSIFISDNTDCFSLDIEDISFLFAPQIVESEKNMGLQADLSTKIRKYFNIA